MKERTCFNCQHSKMCFVRKSVTDATTHVQFNIDGNAAPGKWIDIFKAVAKSCMEFKPKNETTTKK